MPILQLQVFSGRQWNALSQYSVQCCCMHLSVTWEQGHSLPCSRRIYWHVCRYRHVSNNVYIIFLLIPLMLCVGKLSLVVCGGISMLLNNNSRNNMEKIFSSAWEHSKIFNFYSRQCVYAQKKYWTFTNIYYDTEKLLCADHVALVAGPLLTTWSHHCQLVYLTIFLLWRICKLCFGLLIQIHVCMFCCVCRTTVNK